ncbi:MAG: hypothetical protein WCJ09_09365 [Planctomycetota bacterium]
MTMADLPIDWKHAGRGSSALEVFLLGTVELESALTLQSRIVDQLSQRDDQHGVVLVCEHPPAITIGREGSFSDVLVEPEELVARQTEVRWLNRGGGTIAHAPGQVAVYSQVPLHRLNLGLVSYRQRLEQTLVATAADQGVEATPAIIPGATCRCGQFAFIGAAVRDGVTHGGMYVNVTVPHEGLNLVNWSHSGQRVTSLATQRTRPTSMASVRECLIRHLAKSLGYESYHLYTGHPLLRRSTRKVYVYA